MSDVKITIKKKENNKFAFEDIKPGTVYQIDKEGPTLLKLCCGEAVVLKYSSGRDWFEIAQKGGGGFHGRFATKILGKITEIIVDPNV